MGKGRAELFPPDRGLQARMVAAITAGALLTLLYAALLGAIATALVIADPASGFWIALAVFGTPLIVLFVGWVHMRQARMDHVLATREPDAADAERLRTATDRLCVIADLDAPETKVVGNRLPLCWTAAPPWRAPCVHVTTGMLDALPERELLAVVAHELSHIAHRDAVVMTLVGGPSVYVLRSVRHMVSDDPFRGSIFAVVCLYFIVPAIVLGLLSRIVSRHRELAADRSSALITGSPAALASALVRLREDMTGGDILLLDLKLAAPRNQFHVIPVERREPGGLRRVWASHPLLETRLDQLQRMERTLQTARGTAGFILDSEPDAGAAQPIAAPPRG